MKLINEDCLNVMKQMDDNSIDFYLKCDIPYYDTVTVAASKLDKDFVGFELNNEYYEQVKRILNEKAD
jgi:DNA modification methylase